FLKEIKNKIKIKRVVIDVSARRRCRKQLHISSCFTH
ncbi:unnamed protein product, partial [Rotaria magnacalcarata]